MTVRLVRTVDEMLQPDIGVLGQCHPHLEARSAIISVIHPDFAQKLPSGESRIDTETTLVHELLHIPFDAFCPGEDRDALEYRLWEQAIDSLARSLVSLSRV